MSELIFWPFLVSLKKYVFELKITLKNMQKYKKYPLKICTKVKNIL